MMTIGYVPERFRNPADAVQRISEFPEQAVWGAERVLCFARAADVCRRFTFANTLPAARPC